MAWLEVSTCQLYKIRAISYIQKDQAGYNPNRGYGHCFLERFGFLFLVVAWGQASDFWRLSGVEQSDFCTCAWSFSQFECKLVNSVADKTLLPMKSVLP